MKDRKLSWILIGIVLALLFILNVIFIASRKESKPVYFQPAGRPDSIPCSSEINEKCMIYTPLNTFSQESETENNVH